MIARFFEKTNPIIYVILTVVLLLCSVIYSIQKAEVFEWGLLLKSLGVLVVLVIGLIIIERICHKKDITKNNSYAFLIAVLMMLMIPNVFLSWQVALSVIFVLFGFNLLLNMDASKHIKRNIFDASFLILAGVIFEFWAFIFMAMIYFSVVTSFQRDYRNFLVPLVSLFFVALIFITLGVVLEFDYKEMFLSQLQTKFKLDVFESTKEHVGFSFLVAFALIFLINMLMLYGSKTQIKKNAYRKLIVFVIFGFMVFVVSSQKKATQLLFVIYPVSVLGANYLENIRDQKYKNFVLWVLLLSSFLMFFNQLID